MPDPTREDFQRFQDEFGARTPEIPLWLAVDRATQAALMCLGAEAAGVAGAITRLVTEFEAQYDVTLDAMGVRRVGEAWVKARAELRTSDETEMNLPFLAANGSGPKHLARKVYAMELRALELR